MTPESASRRPEEVLILAGEMDAELTADFLRAAGMPSAVAGSFESALRRVGDGDLGALVVAEEKLSPPMWTALANLLGKQHAWSDLPIVLFAGKRGVGPDAQRLGDRSSMTILERPVRRATLLGTVRAALRARRRQYELRDLVARLEDANHRLEENDRRKDEFLAMLGHELRNPLAVIHNALHVLHSSPTEEMMQRQRVVLERQARHLGRIVDDLLDVTRVTMGKITLKMQLVDLRDLVARCAQAMEAEARNYRHELRVETCDQPVWVSGDVVRLEQVLSNLVTNAFKYTPPGGHIKISVECLDEIGVIRVRDDGMGVPADLLPRIFEPFTQADRSLDRSRGGLGLGLPVVRSLIELHGGRVVATSEGADKGAEFVCHLPLTSPASTPPAISEPALSTVSQTALRVVVVEDNPDARETLTELLETYGHHAESAGDGVAGLELIVANRPDVALVDIGLPKLDGYEVARQIRARIGRDQRLIALTGYGQPEDRARALDAGFDAHLVKPVDPAELQRLLSRSSAAQASAR